MATKKKLGRGLDALLGDHSEHDNHPKRSGEKSKENSYHFTEKDLNNQIQDLDIHLIIPNKNQPRQHFDETKIKELAESIKQVGVIEPIVVSKKENQYEIITGERRFKASQEAGYDTIPAVVKNDKKTQKNLFEIMLIENIQREDLSPVETATALDDLVKQKNYTHEKLAGMIGKSRVYITNTLRILKLTTKVQGYINDNKISVGQAKNLIGLSAKEQNSIADDIIKKDLSSREVEKLIRRYNKTERKKQSKNVSRETNQKSPDIIDIENRLKEKFQTKAVLSDKNGKGKIEIDFYSYDELNHILDKIL